MNRNVIFAGFAIFAMFFGSGNIVFPLSLGRISGDVWAYAMIGFFLTAVMVPFLGLLSIVLLKGSSSQFFDILKVWIIFIGKKLNFSPKPLEKIGGNLGTGLELFIIALIGPFCVIPRCITVSFGAFKFTDLQLPEVVFSLLFCLILWGLTLRRERVIPLISQFLTPIKFFLILLLIILGISSSPQEVLKACEPTETFFSGALLGYNTMDLSAAIFFAAAIMGFFKSAKIAKTPQELLKDGLIACTIGASLLTGVYICFVYLGAIYAPITCHVANVEILPTIARHAFGSAAGIFFCITIIFSCLTTSVALLSCWMDTLRELKLFNGISYQKGLLVSLLISYSIAVFLGFDHILHFMGPILEILYPVLIIMAAGHLIKIGILPRLK